MTKPARPQQKSSPSLATSAAVAAAHRLFPLASGAWFAALFGLGAVAAGGEALASLVAHLHLPAILPSAAPPLGTTAHILIAGALTGLGAAFGLVLGLVLHARARASLGVPLRVKPARETAPVGHEETPTPRVRNRDAHPDAPPRRPLVVTEDVLPYHAPAAAPIEPQPVTTPPAWTAHVIESDSPLDHDETPLGAFMTPHPGALSADHGAEVPPFFAASTGEAPPLAQSGIYGAGEATVLPPETVAPVDRAPVLPVEDAAPVFHAGPMPLASQAAVAPHEPIADVALGSLGLVQLIERLALAITVRQALREEGHPAAVAEAPEPLLAVKRARLGQVSDDAAHSGAAQPAHASAPLHNPFMRHDAAHDAWAEASDDTLPPRFLRSSGHAPADTSVLETTVLAPEEPRSPFGTARNGAASAEARYSSLAGVAVVRPDQVVPFPVQTGETPVPAREPTDDADRALRDALATLRRMSAQR